MSIFSKVLITVICCSSLTCNAMTLKQYLDAKKSSSDSMKRIVSDTYLNGASQAYIISNEEAKTTGGKYIFCPPRNLSFGHQELKSVIDSWIKANPSAEKKLTDYPIEIVAMDGLKYIYPCN